MYTNIIVACIMQHAISALLVGCFIIIFQICHFINMSEMPILQDKFAGDVCMWPCVGLLHFPSACFKTQ